MSLVKLEQAYNCLIHFYKRFQIKLKLPGPKVGLIKLLRRPIQPKQTRGAPELRLLRFLPLVTGTTRGSGG